jgi:NIMA (never in mitosis gene a)-related kinase
MVMKKVRLARQSEAQRKASFNEMQLVPTLSHPFIVNCHDAWVERGHTICIVYGYCESGDLASYLRQRAKVRKRPRWDFIQTQ